MNTTVRLGVGMAAAVLLAGMLAALVFGVGRADARETDVYNACRPSKDVVETSGLPVTVDQDRCPVEGRNLASEDGVTVVFPGEGEIIAVSASTADGSEQDFKVVNLPGDTFRVEESSHDPARSRGDLAAQARSNGCSSSAYNLDSYKVYGTLNFSVNAGSIPGYLSEKAAITDIRSGGAHITNVHNPCGVGDGVGAKILYKGKTGSSSDVTPTGCGGSDGRNVVGFGPISGSSTARTCTYVTMSSGFDRVQSSDVRFDTNVRWSTGSGCRMARALESTATHERGHTFGLDHVSALGQTMRSGGPQCDNSRASLGRGDSLGLNRIY